jgi:hypothetical protein
VLALGRHRPHRLLEAIRRALTARTAAAVTSGPMPPPGSG